MLSYDDEEEGRTHTEQVLKTQGSPNKSNLFDHSDYPMQDIYNEKKKNDKTKDKEQKKDKKKDKKKDQDDQIDEKKDKKKDKKKEKDVQIDEKKEVTPQGSKRGKSNPNQRRDFDSIHPTQQNP